MHQLLKLVFLLPLIIDALRLTPVDPSTQRVDLVQEARQAGVALQQAILEVEQHGEKPVRMQLALSSVQVVHSMVARWDRLRGHLQQSPITTTNAAAQVGFCNACNRSTPIQS